MRVISLREEGWIVCAMGGEERVSFSFFHGHAGRVRRSGCEGGSGLRRASILFNGGGGKVLVRLFNLLLDEGGAGSPSRHGLTRVILLLIFPFALPPGQYNVNRVTQTLCVRLVGHPSRDTRHDLPLSGFWKQAVRQRRPLQDLGDFSCHASHCRDVNGVIVPKQAVEGGLHGRRQACSLNPAPCEL